MCDHPLFSDKLPDPKTFQLDPTWMALAAVAGESVTPDQTFRPVRPQRQICRVNPYSGTSLGEIKSKVANSEKRGREVNDEKNGELDVSTIGEVYLRLHNISN